MGGIWSVIMATVSAKGFPSWKMQQMLYVWQWCVHWAEVFRSVIGRLDTMALRSFLWTDSIVVQFLFPFCIKKLWLKLEYMWCWPFFPLICVNKLGWIFSMLVCFFFKWASRLCASLLQQEAACEHQRADEDGGEAGARVDTQTHRGGQETAHTGNKPATLPLPP